MSNSSQKVDVLVVGAGLSGLTAARYLLKKDPSLKVLVLEGKDRVGGRTLTVPLKTATGTDSWDLGAQWVGRCQEHIMELLKELGLDIVEQYISGTKLLQLGKEGLLRTYNSSIPTLSLLALLDLDRAIKRIDGLSREVDPSDPYACKRAPEWDSMTLDTFINQTMWTADAKETIQVAIHCITGSDSSQMSTLFFLAFVSAAGGLKNLTESTPYTCQEYRVKGGTQQISKLMASELGSSRVILKEGVCSISQTEELVTVKTVNGKTYTCQRAILAIPPPQKGKIHFEPLLPTAAREVIKRMPMANYSKVLITYKEAFWRSAGKSGESVTNGGVTMQEGCTRGPLCMTFDDTTENGNPALVAFIVGPQLVEWRQVESEARKAAVLQTLASFFGPQSLDCVDYREHDWDQEPYIEGAPICPAAPGVMRYFSEGLRKPCGRLHFAGTETATVWTGYMSGAVQAGCRAAMEVLQHLNPGLLTQDELEANNRPFAGPS